MSAASEEAPDASRVPPDTYWRLVGAVLARAVLLVVLLVVGGLAWLAAALPVVEATLAEPTFVPSDPVLALSSLVGGEASVALEVTEAWEKVPIVVTADDLLRDPTLWNRLHFDDWDQVPEPLREVGLERMIARYRSTASGPRAWAKMRANDWDRVPQPVRAIAYLRIAEHWAREIGVGSAYGVSPRDAADTLGALIMVESWFEHRSTNVDVEGNRDLGLPQASDYFRARLEAFHRVGALEFSMEEADYFDPWPSIRAGAVWLDVMIGEAEGDLDLAVRAYRKGIAAARQGEAAEYAQNVERKRSRYIRNRSAPPAWAFLWRRLR